MPLVFSKDPKTGKKTSRYVAPKPKLSRREQREQRAAAYGTGGKFENNIFRGLSRSLGIDKRDDEKQIARLKKYPEQASERYRQVQRNVADAAATGGFNFDNLFMGTNIDRRDEDEVRVRPEEDYTNISGSIDSTDKENPYVAAAANYGNTALGQYLDPNRYNAFRTNQAYGTSNRPSGLLGGLYDALGGTTVDEVMSTYPDNTPTAVVNNRPVGNFNNLPPTERSLSGGLLGTPTFNFDVAPFGGAGVYDKIMLDAIQNSPFGSGIALNPSLTPSVAKSGFLGLNPSGTINIGNIGTVTDQFGRELSGQEKIDFINSEFNKLKNRNDALSNFNLGILR